MLFYSTHRTQLIKRNAEETLFTHNSWMKIEFCLQRHSQHSLNIIQRNRQRYRVSVFSTYGHLSNDCVRTNSLIYFISVPYWYRKTNFAQFPFRISPLANFISCVHDVLCVVSCSFVYSFMFCWWRLRKW